MGLKGAQSNLIYTEQNLPNTIAQYEKALNFDPEDMAGWQSLATTMFEIKAFKEVILIWIHHFDDIHSSVGHIMWI